MSNANENYSRTFSSFSGADIVATFHGRVIGELQAISYSIVREVAPIYTMGSPDPRSFSRGKRGISGSLIFTQFDRDALVDELSTHYEGAPSVQTFQQFVANSQAYSDAINNGLNGTERGYGVKAWDNVMTNLGYASVNGANFNENALTGFYTPEYADQLLPFNITISMANEFGQRAGMELFDIQILNEGSGFSVDDVVSAKAYTFVARKIKGVKPKDNLRATGSDSFSATGGDFFKSMFG